MNNILKFSMLSVIASSSLLASGYRIPENSAAAMAKAGANYAYTNGADSAYNNPANMSFLTNGSYIESMLTYINLPKVKYTDDDFSNFNNKSREEHFLVPTLHYVSPELLENTRLGVSLVGPGGLAKRWYEGYGKMYAEEFSLKIFELSTSLSYKINDHISIGGGPRAVYIRGTVKSDGKLQAGLHTGISNVTTQAGRLYRNLSGDSLDFGYNLALTIKPTQDWTLAATYRSKVDMTVKGTAQIEAPGLQSNGHPIPRTSEFYDGDASITIPLPASLVLATAYTYNDTTLEFAFERTFWSAYKDLDFDYDRKLTGIAGNKFDDPNPKKWKNSNAYRIGLTHKINKKFTVMGGFAIDKTPANKDYIKFELPDSDAKLFSAGLMYKYNNQTTFGISYLFDKKKKLRINQRTPNTKADPSGEFTNAKAHLLGLSVNYNF